MQNLKGPSIVSSAHCHVLTKVLSSSAVSTEFNHSFLEILFRCSNQLPHKSSWTQSLKAFQHTTLPQIEHGSLNFYTSFHLNLQKKLIDPTISHEHPILTHTGSQHSSFLLETFFLESSYPSQANLELSLPWYSCAVIHVVVQRALTLYLINYTNDLIKILHSNKSITNWTHLKQNMHLMCAGRTLSKLKPRLAHLKCYQKTSLSK